MSDFDPFGDAPVRAATQGPSRSATSGLWATSSPGATADGEVPRDDAGRILVVCTGNVCRSPYLERRLRHGLADTRIEVTSAGTMALVDHPVDPGSGTLLTEMQIPWEDFRARQLTPELVRRSDLVLTAAREHRADATQIARTGLDRTFALVDFADLVAGVREDDFAGSASGNAVADLVAIARHRRPQVHARVDGADIRDPFRKGPREFEAMQREAEEPLRLVIRALTLAASVRV